MNCDTIDSILDDHRSPRLSPAERQDLAAHLAGCIRCTGGSSAHDTLAGEKIAEPPPELFARVLVSVSAGRVHALATRRRGRRMVGVAAAAAAAVALVAVVARYSPLDFGAAGDGSSPERTVVAAQAAPRFVAGRDYDVLAAPLPSTADAEGVAVTEFFMFRCFPCYAFEPELTRWSAGTSGQVALTRVPVLFNPEAALHARAFYTAEALGKLDAMHAAFYDEIHVRGNRLSSREALAEFFARFDVDGATFDAVFDSADVDARVQRAVALRREYRIDAVPALVVAGRYVTNLGMTGPDVLAVVDQL
ncbi:MAG: thiol:disulfide interchange protein DsbA/DsbL, partial [Lysobacterales bacterium]